MEAAAIEEMDGDLHQRLTTFLELIVTIKRRMAWRFGSSVDRGGGAGRSAAAAG